METEALIGNLCNEAALAQKPSCPLRSVVLGLLSVALYLGLFFAAMGVRPDFAVRLRYPPYALEMAFCALTIAAAIFAASWQAFPDLSERRLMTWFPMVPLSGFFASFGLGYVVAPGGHIDTEAGMTCAMHMCLIALLPTALLYLVLARGVFIHAARASAQVGLASAMTAYLAARVAEQTDDMLHLMVWHIVPTFVFVVLMGGIHRWLIRRKKV